MLIQEQIKKMSVQIDLIAGLGHSQKINLRQKLVEETMGTLNNLVVFMNDEDRAPKLSKFEQFMESLDQEDDDQSTSNQKQDEMEKFHGKFHGF